ncbi:zinc metalloprotease HtpX [bacterium Unc6]|nr:zinc metalloprotease HtpX [bacterium Unc6]
MGNLYEQIIDNKIRSWFLIIIFLIIVIGLGWLLGRLSGMGWGGLIIAFFIAFITGIFSYYYSDKIVLAVSGAKPVKKEDFPYLVHTVEGLAIAAGVPTPGIYFIKTQAPNAFATGRDPQHSSIAVTTGLLERLNRKELEGVVAHEMSHIKNFDIRISTLASILVGTVAILSRFFLQNLIWGGGRRRGGGGGRDGGLGAILIIVGIVLAILTPFIAQLIHLALSRQREFLADASGAELTRYPEGLAGALLKISADSHSVETASEGTAHMYFANPFGAEKRIFHLFSTHPPVKERIKRLREM